VSVQTLEKESTNLRSTHVPLAFHKSDIQRQWQTTE